MVSHVSVAFASHVAPHALSSRLSLALRKGKEEVERTNRLLKTAPALQTSTSLPALNTVAASGVSDTHSSLHVAQTRTNTFHVDERAHARSAESPSDSPSTERSHASDADTASAKKKCRKQEEHLQQILDSPDCLNEAALTLNFLTRRLFCDVFEETLFKDLLKEKIQLKLKEIAVSEPFTCADEQQLVDPCSLAHRARRSPCGEHRPGKYLSHDPQSRADAVESQGHLVQALCCLPRQFQV